jgi:hypothetical protein
MIKKGLALITILVLISCSSDNSNPYNDIAGNYTLKSVTTDVAVDYNADGIFENDITPYISCSSNLNIMGNGEVAWIGMSLQHSSCSIELNTGNIVDYSSCNCNTAASNYTGSITENNNQHIMILSMFNQNVELVKSGNKLILKDNSTLVVKENNVLKLKSITINYGYQKN